MISVVLHDGPGLSDYAFHLANALAEVARVAWSVDESTLERFGAALSNRVTPLVYQRPRRRQLWGFQEMQRQSRAILAFGPDLFHLQADGLWESVLLRMLAPLPVVNTIHDPVKHIDQRTLLNAFLQKDSLRRARGWVVHSAGLKRIFIDQFHVDPQRVLVHPHGIFDYYLRFVPPQVERQKTILFFGELRYNKGCDILLRSFETVKDQLPGWKVVVAGRGNGLSDAQSVIVRLGDRLDFRPRFIPAGETAELFSRAGIVALPYRHGTQSGVLAIAAAFGCPVLATRTGSFPDILQDNQHVLFVAPEEEAELAQGLLALARDNSLRAQLGHNLAQHARASWSWQAIAFQTAQFYAQILPT